MNNVEVAVSRIAAAGAAVLSAEDHEIAKRLADLGEALEAGESAVSAAYKRSKTEGRAALTAIKQAGGDFAQRAGLARIAAARNPELRERETRARTRQLAREQAGSINPEVRKNAIETLEWLRVGE